MAISSSIFSSLPKHCCYLDIIANLYAVISVRQSNRNNANRTQKEYQSIQYAKKMLRIVSYLFDDFEFWIILFLRLRMKRSMDDWKIWGRSKKAHLYFYEQMVLDLTDFCLIHPGGKKALFNYVYKDITQTLFTIYPHDIRILEKLKVYAIGFNLSYKPNPDKPNRSKSHKTTAKGSKSKKKVCFRKSIHNNQDKKENVQVFSKNFSTSSHKLLGEKSKQQVSSKKSKEGSKKNTQVSIKVISETQIEECSCSTVKSVKLEQLWESNRVTDIKEIDEEKALIKIPFLQVKTMSEI